MIKGNVGRAEKAWLKQTRYKGYGSIITPFSRKWSDQNRPYLWHIRNANLPASSPLGEPGVCRELPQCQPLSSFMLISGGSGSEFWNASNISLLLQWVWDGKDPGTK